MAVLGRVLLYSGERIDTQDVRAIDSYIMGDFKYLVQSLIGETTSYILKGFEVVSPSSSIGTSSLSIRVADSIVYFPSSTAAPFYYGLPIGNSLAADIVPVLQSAVSGTLTNYLYLVLSNEQGTPDIRAFLDRTLDNEFDQIVNTQTFLIAEIGVSTAGFPDGTVPISEVVMVNGSISSITDCRNLLFRLGTGGLNPNIYNTFNFPSLPSSTYERTEPPITVDSGSLVNSFQGADKNLHSLKDWMDTVMTKLKEIGGTSFWYEYASAHNIKSLFIDTLGSTMTSKGYWSHDLNVPGFISWSEDFHIKGTAYPVDIVVETGSLSMLDDQVLYLPLIRNLSVNSLDLPLSWTSGASYVDSYNGNIGLFDNLSQGDWIKSLVDTDQEYVRIEQFWDTLGGTGLVTTPASALSVTISTPYLGGTSISNGTFIKGRYTSTDVISDYTNSPNITASGGDFYWLALRSDIINAINNITQIKILGDATLIGNGRVRIQSLLHGLLDNQKIIISGSVLYDGTYSVQKEDDDNFVIVSSALSNEAALPIYWAIVNTTARLSSGGLVEESANHGLKTDDMVIIDNADVYNTVVVATDWSVFVIDSTNFSIPCIGTGINNTVTSYPTGTAALAKINIRLTSGSEDLVRGETVYIESVDTKNLMDYVGMGSNSESIPVYLAPNIDKMLDGTTNYGNNTENDSLTTRAARLTSMMADKAQDRTLKINAENLFSVTNTINGIYEDITFQGRVAKNEIQTITFNQVPVAGYWTIYFNGDTTGHIIDLSDITGAASIQSALELLPSIGAGNVLVTGSYTLNYVVEFISSLSNMSLPFMITDTSNLS